MRFLLPFATAVVLALPPVAAAQPDCAYDRAAMLALGQQAFDQDMRGGWRALDNRGGCEIVAADLIRDYRLHHRNTAEILIWHEAQLRAIGGETAAAIALFEQTRRPDASFGMNAYLDATLAFLRKDRPAILAARRELASLPEPADFKARAAEMKARTGFALTWPPNLNVVDDLIACFDKAYREAYGRCALRKPTP